MIRIVFIFIFILFAENAFCQKNADTIVITDSTDLSDYSLEELSKLKSRYKATDIEKNISQAIEAASHKALPLRKTPSIISVITEDDILKSGARELMDVFKLIPGIDFNVDVEGVVGISFRGMWANEGNLLLQFDGQEMNENAYSSLQLGNHYPISNIKKIEVIRGPGSAIYGGCAEYAVINIITKKGDEIKGISVEGLLAQTANSYSRQDLTLTIGNKINDFNYAMSGFIGRGQRSNFDYTDVYGKSFNMTNNSNLNPQFFNFNIGYKHFSFTFIYDNYRTTTRDGYISSLSQPYPCDFLSYMTELKYTKKINKKFEFFTKLNYKHSTPYTFDGNPALVDSSYGYYKVNINRYRLNITSIWEPAYWVNAQFGFEGNYDEGFKPNGYLFVTDNSSYVSYINYAPFAQILINTRFANITLGARYDFSSAFGSAFNPRLGITKKVGIVNFKLLYASSFRAPSIENIQYEIDKIKLKPEQTKTIEFETSVKISKNMFLSVNLFDITTQNAIRYFVKTDSVINGDPDVYRNINKIIGSQGAEIEYYYKTKLGFIKVIYSYFSVGNKNVDSSNIVANDRTITLGNAQNKLTVMGNKNIGKYFFVTPSINFLDKRYADVSTDSSGKEKLLEIIKPQAIFNIYLGCNDLVKNLFFGIGINNITNERKQYLQAYNSLHATLPGLGREFFLKLNYKIQYTEKK